MGLWWVQQSYAMRRSPPFLEHTKNTIASGIFFFPLSKYGAIRLDSSSSSRRIGRSCASSYFSTNAKPQEICMPTKGILHRVLRDSKTGGLKCSNLRKEEETHHGSVLMDHKDAQNSISSSTGETVQPSVKHLRRSPPSKVCRAEEDGIKGLSVSSLQNVQVRDKNGRKMELTVKSSDGSGESPLNSAKLCRDVDDQVNGSSLPSLQNVQFVSKGGRKKEPNVKVSNDNFEGLVESLGCADDGCNASKLPFFQSAQLAKGARKSPRTKVNKKDIEDLVNSSLNLDNKCNSVMLQRAESECKGAQKISRSKKVAIIQDDQNSLQNEREAVEDSSLWMPESPQLASTSTKKRRHVEAPTNDVLGPIDSSMATQDEMKASGLTFLQNVQSTTPRARRTTRAKVCRKASTDFHKSSESEKSKLLKQPVVDGVPSTIDSSKRNTKVEVHVKEEKASMITHDEMNASGLTFLQNAPLTRPSARKTTCGKVCRKASTDFHESNEVEKNKLLNQLVVEGIPSTIDSSKRNTKVEIHVKEEKAALKLFPMEANSRKRGEVLGLEMEQKKENKEHIAVNKDQKYLCKDDQITSNHNGIILNALHDKNDETTGMLDTSKETSENIEKPCDTRGIRNIKVSRRFKKNPEEMVSLLKLHTCSKYGDLHGALELYDDVKREGIVKLNINFYSSLLYICSGAASGTLTRSKSGSEKKAEEIKLKENSGSVSMISNESSKNSNEVISFSPEDMELAARRGVEIYEHMLEVQAPLNEAIFTSLSRLAVAKGDGDLAFDIVKKMVSQGIAPKLRSYGPALICFCEKSEIHKAFEVDKHMAEASVLPDENILENLLKVSIEAGHEEKVYCLLHRLRKRFRDLSPTTVKTIESWFNSEDASSVGKLENNNSQIEVIRKAIEANGGGWHGLGWLGKGKWKVMRTNLSKNGLCLSCGEKLCTIDLDPIETTQFAETIAQFACEREHLPNQFKEFQKWLDRNGPYGAILDGANIGLYNPQVFRGFSFKLLSTVMNKAGATVSNKSPSLILLHNRHSTRIAQSASDEAMINKWKKEKALYFTPQGSNDDWYWLYAAVKCKCLLVTNDEMRDHIFELLGTDFFPKWKERHQVRFTFSPKGLELHMPPPYSIIIQESEHGSWHIPQVGGNDIDVPREWLCATRPTN